MNGSPNNEETTTMSTTDTCPCGHEDHVMSVTTTDLKRGDRILTLPGCWDEVVSVQLPTGHGVIAAVRTIRHWSDEYTSRGWDQDQPSFFHAGISATHDVLPEGDDQ